MDQLEKEGFIRLLRGQLSVEVCNNMMMKMELTKKWEGALINTGNGQQLDCKFRKCQRIMTKEEPEFLNLLLDIIKPHIPQFDEYTFAGINPMLRFLKYEPGGFFQKHYDGNYTAQDDSVSLVTVQVYLNDGYVGGETSFFSEDEQLVYSHKGCIGDVLMFDQDVFLHCGETVQEGNKYVVRTELMYFPKEAV